MAIVFSLENGCSNRAIVKSGFIGRWL